MKLRDHDSFSGSAGTAGLLPENPNRAGRKLLPPLRKPGAGFDAFARLFLVFLLLTGLLCGADLFAGGWRDDFVPGQASKDRMRTVQVIVLGPEELNEAQSVSLDKLVVPSAFSLYQWQIFSAASEGPLIKAYSDFRLVRWRRNGVFTFGPFTARAFTAAIPQEESPGRLTRVRMDLEELSGYEGPFDPGIRLLRKALAESGKKSGQVRLVSIQFEGGRAVLADLEFRD